MSEWLVTMDLSTEGLASPFCYLGRGYCTNSKAALPSVPRSCILDVCDTASQHRQGVCQVAHRANFSSAFPLPSVLFVLLWPLAVYHRLGHRMYLKLEPALQRLDFSVRGYMISKQREKQRKFLEGVSGPSDTDTLYLN